MRLRVVSIVAAVAGRRTVHAGGPGITAAMKGRADEIFSLIEAAPLLFISAPIYFYSLPAHFKALIDRSQRFWAAQNHASATKPLLPRPPIKPTLVSLVAGRPRGNLLFSGSLLTLRYFLSPLNATISETRLLREHSKR